MLDLPQSDMSEYIKENSFVSNAIKMLQDWSSLKPTASTLHHLAALSNEYNIEKTWISTTKKRETLTIYWTNRNILLRFYL